MKKHLLAGLAAACLAGPASSATTLTVSLWTPPTHMLSQQVAKWCADVAQGTESRVKCNVLPKPVVAPPATLDAIRDGLADVSLSVHGYTPGRYLLTQIAEMPFLGDTSEATSVAYQRIFERHLSKLGEHKGLKVLTVFTHGPGEIYNTKRPVASLEDARGLKLRVGGGMVNEIAKSLGLNVTLKPSTESYELISSGVMDGVLFPPESVEAFKIDKLLRHRTTFPGGLYNTSFVFVMNQGVWDKLPAADRDAIAKVSGESAARMFGRGWDAADRRGAAYLQAGGTQVVAAGKPFVDEIRARTAPLEKKWVEDARARGLADPEAVLREFRAEIARR